MSRSLEVRESSALRRVNAHRDLLVIDLLTRHGPFWEAIRALRERWGITPAVTVPPPLESGIETRPWDTSMYAPITWPTVLPPSPLAEPPDPSSGFFSDISHEDELGLVHYVNNLHADEEIAQNARNRLILGDALSDAIAKMSGADLSPDSVRQSVEEERAYHCHHLWWLDLRRMHDHFVPKPCRARGPDPAAAWNGFFSMCLVCDPPPQELVRFVNAAPVGVTMPPDILRRPEDEHDAPIPIMVNAPIVSMRDADEVEAATREFYETLLEHLSAAVSLKGIDLVQLRKSVEANHPELEQRRMKRRSQAAIRSYIAPDEHTTVEDVKQAFVLLQSRRPGGQPKHRDRLLTVQIAIWQDSFGVTVKDIANALGWELREDEHGTLRRSDRVSDHTKQGRRLLKERNCAADQFGPGRK